MANDVINILMCGGRRAGKTSILAGMQAIMQEKFSGGQVRMLPEKNQEILVFQDVQKSIVAEPALTEIFTYADQGPTNARTEFCCKIRLNDNKTPMSLNFIDVPGEWFLAPQQSKDFDTLMKDMANSRIIVIAVDSPHLMEDVQDGKKTGKYHEVFNRAEVITDLMKKAFAENKNMDRLVLLVPVKCEKYTESKEFNRPNQMGKLLEAVKAGYEGMLKNLTDDSMKAHCTVAICPVVTMGGLVFSNFEPLKDADGNPLKDADGKPLEIQIGKSGYLEQTSLSRYLYLRRNIVNRFYEPMDCEQPLLHILLFFVVMGRLRAENAGIFEKMLNIFLNILPDQTDLEACKKMVLPMLKKDPAYGFKIIQDPMGAYKLEKE